MRTSPIGEFSRQHVGFRPNAFYNTALAPYEGIPVLQDRHMGVQRQPLIADGAKALLSSTKSTYLSPREGNARAAGPGIAFATTMPRSAARSEGPQSPTRADSIGLRAACSYNGGY